MMTVKERREKYRAELLPEMGELFDGLCELLDRDAVLQYMAPYCGYRSPEDQNDLYTQGRRGLPGELTATDARAWESPHQYCLAVDWALFAPGLRGQEVFTKAPWKLFGEKVVQAGLKWGGSFRDRDNPHVEYPISIPWARIAITRQTEGEVAAMELLKKSKEIKVCKPS